MYDATLRGVLAIFIYRDVRMKGQIQTQKIHVWIHCKVCTQKYCYPVYLLPKNMGDNFILVKFDSKELFLRHYIIELRENGNC